MYFKGIIAAAIATLGVSSFAHAEGLTLKLEGGLGFNFGEGVGIFTVVRDAPATDTSQLNFEPGIPRGPFSMSYRAEANWALTLGNGTLLRFGGIFSGIEGSSSELTPAYGGLASRPGGPEPELPQAEIWACSFPDPCITFEGNLDRSYHEVMPELMFGREGPEGGVTWIGLQGFSGSLAETSANRMFTDPSSPFPTDRTTLTDLEADASGVMLAIQQERPLASGMTLLLGAGLGTYRIDASGFSLDPDAPGSRKDVTGEFDGLRAQLMVGLEKPLSDRLALGATVRADHWTDQPRIKHDWIHGECSPTLCSPPSFDGNFNIATDPLTSVTLGLSLTLRM